MVVSAQQIFKELLAKEVKPLYLILGEETFQKEQIIQRFRQAFTDYGADPIFDMEKFDGESLNVESFLTSVETLPGLFGGGHRFILCRNFDKLSSGASERLTQYFVSPSSSTCLLMVASKMDKRKSTYKLLEKQASVIEVREPYEREWPRWKAYLEKSLSKSVEREAWDLLLIYCNCSLSIVWSELQKMALFVGNQDTITVRDLRGASASIEEEDVFEFVSDTVAKRRSESMKKFFALVRQGENEVKLLSLLVRQFRQAQQCCYWIGRGVKDSKRLATELGVPPFVVAKITENIQGHTKESLNRALELLGECDYRLKTGTGRLLEDFLMPYYSQ